MAPRRRAKSCFGGAVTGTSLNFELRRTRAQQQIQVGVTLLSFARHMRRVGGDALQQVDIIGAPIMTMTWREFESSCFDRASTLNR